MKRLAIGVSDFKKIIEGDFYYFDKTKFIEEIIKDGSEVKLFARPRRFGKTLNMSMLKYFFDIKEAEENRKLFKDLYIEKTENFKEQGQYPVIFLSLKDLKARTWEEMERGIKNLLQEVFSEHKYLIKELDEFDLSILKKIINKEVELESGLNILVGNNETGKSTLIDILTGIQSMDSGDIFINGKSIKTDKVEIRKHLGLVPQDIALLEELNAVDNLEYFGGLYGLAGAELKSQIEKLLEVAGLTDKKKEKVKNYSGGMKRRLNIAVAMLHNPSILILDEPTVGVDAQSRQHIFDYIQSLAEQGTTILYTSHYMEEIEALCKRVFILDLGEEVAYGTKEGVKKLVGHTQTVALTLDRVPAGFDEVLKNSENGIQFVTVDGQDIALTIDQTIFSMMKLIEQVEKAQLVIKSVNVNETTLEEAFLHLTGKTHRD